MKNKITEIVDKLYKNIITPISATELLVNLIEEGDKNTTTKPIQWVSMKERKPSKDGRYFWKGKNGCAGKDFYDSSLGEFEFNNNIPPSNWVADEHLYWLDEGDF